MKEIDKEWTTLNLKIQNAKKKNEAEHKTDPKCDVPNLVLDELRELNYRHKELSLAKAKSPAIQASILAAQASLRRLPSNQNKFNSGVGRARRIRSQVKQLETFGTLIFSQSGFGSKHPSMLDDHKLSSTISTWSSSKKPGEVSFSSNNHCTNYILIDQILNTLLTLCLFGPGYSTTFLGLCQQCSSTSLSSWKINISSDELSMDVSPWVSASGVSQVVIF